MRLLLLSFLLVYTSTCYCNQCDSIKYTRQYTLLLVQFKSIEKIDDGYLLNFIPCGTYTTHNIKLVVLDTPKSFNVDIFNTETKYYKKLRMNKFTTAWMENLLEGKAKSSYCFLRGYIKIRPRPMNKFKNNEMLFLKINHTLSSESRLIIDFIVEPKQIDISNLILID